MLSRVNNFRADPSGQLGALVMLGFSAWAGWRWAHTGLLFFFLLLLRDLLAVWFLLVRRPSSKSRGFGFSDVIAYISSGLPLLYFAPTFSGTLGVKLVASLLPIIGFSMATIALIDLGESFGVSPANRGRVDHGIYRVLRHPMYLGYSIAEIGLVLLDPWNALIWVASVSLYFIRARREEALVQPEELTN